MENLKKNTENKEKNGRVKDEKKEVVEEKDFTQYLLEHTIKTMYLPDDFLERFGPVLLGKTPKEE